MHQMITFKTAVGCMNQSLKKLLKATNIYAVAPQCGSCLMGVKIMVVICDEY